MFYHTIKTDKGIRIGTFKPRYLSIYNYPFFIGNTFWINWHNSFKIFFKITSLNIYKRIHMFSMLFFIAFYTNNKIFLII